MKRAIAFFDGQNLLEQGRWIKVACAFPSSPSLDNRRGIDKTDWIRIERATCNACLDPRATTESSPDTC